MTDKSPIAEASPSEVTALTELQAKLFEAGRIAGLQQVVIDKLVACNQATGAAITEALLMLEQAHTAAHQDNLPGCMEYVAQAMEILASDD